MAKKYKKRTIFGKELRQYDDGIISLTHGEMSFYFDTNGEVIIMWATVSKKENISMTVKANPKYQ